METQYNPADIEQKWFQEWETGGYFKPTEGEDHDNAYCIVIPPPNVTGALHLGHALNNTIQDTLIRWQRMKGKDTLWVPGTDHAGIATQAVVEKRLLEDEGKTRHDLGRAALVERIWNWKHEYEARITGQLKKLGCSCDWSRQRFTLDPVCALAVRHTFHNLFKKDLIYRGKRLVNWDTHLQTAVADDEIFYETVKGKMWYFKYPLADGSGYLPIATTRPETILGDTALAVHPDDERYKAFIGKKLKVPFVNREIPLIADAILVDPAFGTGCVKVTPAHDPNDYNTGLRNKLEMINILTEEGNINENGGPFQGQPRAQCRKRLVEGMKELGLYVKEEEHEMQVGHSDRSKTPIEPYLSNQWFVNMGDLAKRAMNAVQTGEIKFFPDRYAKGYLDWLGEKRDWCISRQLWWGHRIPIWYCSTCTHSDLDTAFKGNEAISYIHTGEGWVISSVEDLPEDVLGSNHKIIQDPDVLDTWFSSALWPHSTLGWPVATKDLKTFYPTNVLVTSRDIISLWVARMVISGQENMGQVPFPHVYIHTTILDGNGQRMSKSKGNGVDPLDIIEKYGTDALRFTMISLCTENQDARLPVIKEVLPDGKEINTSEKFETGRNFANKIWNAVRFILPHTKGIEPAISQEQLDLSDEWILSLLNNLILRVDHGLGQYRFAEVGAAIYHFTWNEFCSRYLEIKKKAITSEEHTPEKVQAVSMFLYVLQQLIAILHPIMPFITEEINQQLGNNNLLITTRWPVCNKGFIVPAIEEGFHKVIAILESIRSIRGSYSIPRSRSLSVIVQFDNEVRVTPEEQAIILNLENISKINFETSGNKPAFSASNVIAGGQVFVQLEGILDRDAEISSKQKELDKSLKFIQNLERKLSNVKFTANAPASVVDFEREKLQNQKQTADKLKAIIQELT